MGNCPMCAPPCTQHTLLLSLLSSVLSRPWCTCPVPYLSLPCPASSHGRSPLARFCAFCICRPPHRPPHARQYAKPRVGCGQWAGAHGFSGPTVPFLPAVFPLWAAFHCVCDPILSAYCPVVSRPALILLTYLLCVPATPLFPIYGCMNVCGARASVQCPSDPGRPRPHAQETGVRRVSAGVQAPLRTVGLHTQV